ncbi:MAG: hypothetical protein ACFB00_01050 [Parvularculaceae bacterium]
MTYGLSEFFQWRWLNAAPREAAARAFSDLNKRLGHGPAAERPLVLALKARARYATANLDADNPQRQALVRTLSAARKNNVPAIVFYATEKPGLIDQILPQEKRAPLLKALEATIAEADPGAVYIGPMNDLAEARFLDQVHLDAEGYAIVGARIAEAAAPLLSDGVTIADRASRPHTALGWFGALDPYHRGGTIEVYGALLDPVKTSAVGVETARIAALERSALIAWGGRRFRAPDVETLRVAFNCDADVPPAFRVGALLHNGDVHVFSHGATPEDAYTDERNLPNLTPQAFAPLLGAPTSTTILIEEHCGAFKADAPEALKKAFADGASVLHLFLQIPEAADGARFSLSELAFETTAPFARMIRGRMEGSRREGRIVLETQTGEKRATSATRDGGFSFPVSEADAAFSVYFEPTDKKSDRRYSDFGRWFLGSEGSDLRINLGPRFVAAPNDAIVPPRKEQFPPLYNRRRTLELIGSGFPHQRYTFMGRGGDPREWDGYTFANVKGFFDKDRDFERKTECLRIGVAGGSNVTTIMHELSDKATIRLEAELGLALGRCVEALSIGMGAGNLAASLSRAQKYVGDAPLDYLFLEFHPITMFEAHPEIARMLSGVDPAYPKYDTLFYDDNGELSWRRKTPAHRKHIAAVDPDAAVALERAFRTPISDAPSLVRDAYHLAFDIVDYAEKTFPDTKVVPFAYRHAPIRQDEIRGRTTTDGPSILGFAQNVSNLCEIREKTCLITPYADRLSEPDADFLTWDHDNHHNHFGLDYFVETFTDGFVALHRANRTARAQQEARLIDLFPKRSAINMTHEERRGVIATADPERPVLNVYVFKTNKLAIGETLSPLLAKCPNQEALIRQTGAGRIETATDENLKMALEELEGAVVSGIGRVTRLVVRAGGSCPLLPITIYIRNENERARFNRLIEETASSSAFASADAETRASRLVPMCEDLMPDYSRMLSELARRGYSVRPVEDALGAPASDEKRINMRHDVHPRDVPGSICMSYLERREGFASSYHVLKHYTSWEARNAESYELFMAAVSPGHTMSMHTEPVGRYYAATCDGPDSIDYGPETKACLAETAARFMRKMSDYVGALDDAGRMTVRDALTVNKLNCPDVAALPGIARAALGPAFDKIARRMEADRADFAESYGEPAGTSVHGGAFHHNVRRACESAPNVDPVACDLAQRLTSIGGFPFAEAGSATSADVDRCVEQRVFVSDGAHPLLFQRTLEKSLATGSDTDVLTHANLWIMGRAPWRER